MEILNGTSFDLRFFQELKLQKKGMFDISFFYEWFAHQSSEDVSMKDARSNMRDVLKKYTVNIQLRLGTWAH